MADDDQPSAFAPVELQAAAQARGTVSWLARLARLPDRAGHHLGTVRAVQPRLGRLHERLAAPGAAGGLSADAGVLRAGVRLSARQRAPAMSGPGWARCCCSRCALAVVLLALGGNGWGAALLVITVAFMGWLIGWLAGLQDADLRCADLSGADLTGANLTNANLTDALLYGADVRPSSFSQHQPVRGVHVSRVCSRSLADRLEDRWAQLCEAKLSDKE